MTLGVAPARGEEPPPARPPARRGRWQVGLRAAGLVVVAVALGLSIAIDIRRIAVLERKLRTSALVPNEIDGTDATRAAVMLVYEPRWHPPDGHTWDVYLPDGIGHRLCLATRGVSSEGLATPIRSIPISPGRQFVSFQQGQAAEGWEVIATAGPHRLRVVEPLAWHRDRPGWARADIAYDTDIPRDQPLVFVRHIFERPDASGFDRVPAGPADGILVWIEPAAPQPRAGAAGDPAPAGAGR